MASLYLFLESDRSISLSHLHLLLESYRSIFSRSTVQKILLFKRACFFLLRQPSLFVLNVDPHLFVAHRVHCISLSLRFINRRMLSSDLTTIAYRSNGSSSFLHQSSCSMHFCCRFLSPVAGLFNTTGQATTVFHTFHFTTLLADFNCSFPPVIHNDNFIVRPNSQLYHLTTSLAVYLFAPSPSVTSSSAPVITFGHLDVAVFL